MKSVRFGTVGGRVINAFHFKRGIDPSLNAPKCDALLIPPVANRRLRKLLGGEATKDLRMAPGCWWPTRKRNRANHIFVWWLPYDEIGNSPCKVQVASMLAVRRDIITE